MKSETKYNEKKVLDKQMLNFIFLQYLKSIQKNNFFSCTKVINDIQILYKLILLIKFLFDLYIKDLRGVVLFLFRYT
jgi:hypothetical protein